MISVSNVSKSFAVSRRAYKKLSSSELQSRYSNGRFQAISQIEFSCGKGQVLGLLGPNGAGKTTLLRILASSLSADNGSIIINGDDIVKKPRLAKKRVGFLSNKTGLYHRLTAKENIEYFAKLHGMAKSEIQFQRDTLYCQLGIEPYLNKRVEQLSTGMAQKVSIARAVIHQPDVLILDEPTTGLDIMATESILEFIQQQKDAGRSVIFSTHHLEELTTLADKLAILDSGKSIFSGSIAELMQTTGCANVRSAFMSTISQGTM